MTQSVVYWSFNINSKSLKVNRDKVKAIQEWPAPTTLHQFQSFINI